MIGQNTFKMLCMTVLLVSAVSTQFQNRQFFTGGGCSQIKGLGSPILMVANAHKYINDALNSKNPYTDVALLSFTATANATTNATNYKLVFGVTTLKGLEYFAIDFDAFGDGFGAMKTNRMMITPNLNWVGSIFSLDTATFTEINCGDLKFMFSFYGQDPTADLPFVWPGRNQNSVGLNILNRLNIENQNNQNTLRVCIEANYDTTDFIGTPAANLTDGGDWNCSPSGLNVTSFRVQCLSTATTTDILDITFPDGSGGSVTTNVFDQGTGGNDVDEIFDLSQGDTLVFTSDDDAGQLYELYSEGVLVTSALCGTVPAPDATVTVSTEDFMGFDEITALTDLEVVEYIA